MPITVTEIPKKARKSKYDYSTLFDGQIHGLVEGEDFTVSAASVRGALYNRKALHNTENPQDKISLKINVREVEGKTVVFVQKVPFKDRSRKNKPEDAKKTATAPAAKKKTTAKKTADRKPVTPNAK